MPLDVELSVPYLQGASIVVDARLEDEAWQRAGSLGDFTVFEPAPGAVPAGATRVRVLADKAALYLAFEAIDPEPAAVRGSLGRRDTKWEDDFVGFYLDPRGEGQRAYLFGANPAGVQFDGTVTASGEKSSWPRLDPNVQGILVQEAVLGGPGELPRAAGLDLIPELAFGWTHQGPGNHRLGYQGVFPGLTARWTPAPDATVLATVNPDVSEVESDASRIDVNRRWALSYQEKRPFFLEGQEWFQHPFGDLVYTRSMVTPLYGARATAEPGPGGRPRAIRAGSAWNPASPRSSGTGPGPGWGTRRPPRPMPGRGSPTAAWRRRRAAGGPGGSSSNWADRPARPPTSTRPTRVRVGWIGSPASSPCARPRPCRSPPA